MQKIQKFQFNRIYTAPKSSNTYELLDRDGHRLVFRVRNTKTRDSWKRLGTSIYKADEVGAFEEVFFSDGVRLRSDAVRKDPILRRTQMLNREASLQLMEILVA